jgi:cob(I)alamin adenosyltransferase
LIYADQTVGPGGRLMTVEQRLSDMLDRHGPGSPNAVRAPLLRAAVRRVERRLAAAEQMATAGATR